MDFVLSFSSLPPSHALAATSVAFVISSHGSCQNTLSPLLPAPCRASSVAPWILSLQRRRVLLKSCGRRSLPGEGVFGGHKCESWVLMTCKCGNCAASVPLLADNDMDWW